MHKTGECIVVLLPSNKPMWLFMKVDNQKRGKDKSEAKK